MNVWKSVSVRAAFAFLLLTLSFGTAASAATSQFQILLNLDNQINTGCDVPTLTGSFQGAEQILTTTVVTTGASAQVTALQVQSCTNPATDTFGPASAVTPPPGHPLPWTVGPSNGTGGTSVIETFYPLSLSPVSTPPIIRLGVLGFDNSVLVDELVKVQPGQGNGAPILLNALILSASEIPTLSEWGLIFLSLLLAAAAVALLRRRTAAAVLIALLLLGMAGVAWAAACDLNGTTLGEWNAGNLLASETTSDAPAGADIRAFYGFVDDGLNGLCFRIDALLKFNAAPTANNDAATVNEDSGANPVNVLANDTDPESDPLVIQSVTQPANGSVAITGGGTGLTYTPNANYCNTPPGTALDTFTYTLAPGIPPPTTTATVTITVTCVDDNPTAVNDAATVAEDAPATAINVLANDTDPDGGAKSVGAVTQPANGTVVITGGGTGLTYQPNANYCNTPPGTALDTFTYTLAPGGSTATVTVTVTCGDDPPTAVADAATVVEDSGANPIDVLANDTDADAGPKSVFSVTQPANGAVVITGGGTGLTYAPNANYCNTPPGTTLDTFTYTLAPGGSTATVTVTVTCADDAPVAVADAATVAEDSGANAIDVLANDTDNDGGSKSVASVTQPANGTVVITGGGTGLTYQPNANYCNTPPGAALDTFTYTLTPGGSTATVTVTVTCADDNPTAVADAATVVEDSGANAIDVLANDTDPDAGPKSIQSVTQPANGTVVITGGGTGLTYQPNADYCNSVSGIPDTFTYTLTPGGSTATVSVTVTCGDDAPVAVNDAAAVAEDSGANAIDVLANDTDLDGGPKLIQSVTQPANGTVVITGGGTGLTYAPNANYCNSVSGIPDTFTYALTPGGSTATVSVTVACVDDSPVIDLDADDDKGTGGSDFAVTFTEGDAATLIEDPTNDPTGATVTDVDSANLASLTVTITNLLDIGSETLSADVTGTAITANYVPATGVLTLTGPDTVANFQKVLRTVKYQNTDVDPDTTPRVIHFVANDGSSNSNTATSTVTVVSVDTAPTAVADSATVAEDSGANAIDVLANDTDPDNGTKLVQSVTQPANGTVVITGGGTGLTYAPNANYCNSVSGPLDTFTYTLTPGGSSATVTVTVTCADDNPTAVADAATVVEDSGANAIDVLANDTDPDGGPKSIGSVTQPANGTVVITGGGTGLTYAPNANYCNSVSGPLDTFTYTLTPGGSTATVTVTVTCVDDNPTAVADAATVVEDSGANAIDVLANDTDPDGGTKSVASVTQPANGVVVITGGGTGVTYAPNANYCNSVSGPLDTFTYTLTPGGSSATVTVTVTCVDDNPVAVADAATVAEDSGANAIDVLANDTDIDNGPKSVASVTQPTNGTVVITGGGTGLTYAPNANYCNSVSGPLDTFTYTLTPGGSSTTVTVTVTCVDDNPVAVADAATVVEDSGANAIDVLANDTDIDAGPKSVTSVTQPANGVVVITGGGTGLTYAPNANYCNSVSGIPDTFTYTLTPGGSSTTVTVTVTCVDDNPVAVADAATVVEDSGANAIDVLANDTDVDGGTKSVASVTQPANGVVVITGGGTGLTYAPNANYCNSVSGPLDTFTYTLTPGGSSTTVTVTVTCVDDPPVAVADAATVLEDSGATAIPVLANDTDIDGGPISITSVTQPANGTVVITGGGTGLTYAPNANYCNSLSGPLDTFTYTLTPAGATPTATVTMTVTCVNDPPLADNDTFDFIGNTDLVVDQAALPTPHALETTGTTFGVLDGDSDPVENNAIAVSSITVGACTDSSAPFDCSDPAVGRVQMQTNGRFIFTPAPGDVGATETFQYTVTDDGLPAPASTTATVTLTRFERVWYVKNDAPAGGNGTSASPFNSITAANLSDNDGDGDLTDDLDSAGDYIFVYFGTGTATNQSGGLVLENGQHLIGQHAGLSLNVNLNGNGAPTNLVAAAAGSRPLLDDTVVDAFEGVSARNVIPAEIVGMNLAGNVNGIDWTTTAAFAGTGTFEIRDNVVRSATNEGVDINLAGTGATRLSFHDNNLTATGTALDIQETGTGALTITAFDENVVSGNTGGSGIIVSNAVFDSVPGGGLDTVDAITVMIGALGNGVGGAGMALGNVQGDLHFSSNLNIFADGGAGLSVSGTGAGMQLRVNSGGAPTGIIEAIGGPAVDANTVGLDLRLTSLKSTNSASTGVSLTNVTGTFSGESGSSITNATGTDFAISGGTAAVTYKGTITDDVGQLVSVANATTGTKSFQGAITDGDDGDGNGVSLSSNTGATIRFSGGLVLSTGANAAFAATGGGTVEVCDENPCNPGATGGTINKLTTTTGTALNVANTTIGSNKLEFRSISANGAANGIVLNTTGAGGLTVSGTGSAGTGGTISASTGAGISLTNTGTINLSYMNVQNGGDDGIRGSGVNGLNLTNLSITSNGNAVGERGIDVTQLTGSGSMANCTVSGSAEHNVNIANTSGTLSAFNVTNSAFTNTNMTTGDDGFLFENNGSGSMTVSITGSTFTDNKGDHFQAATSASATGSINVTFSNNTLTTTAANDPNVVGGGITLSPSGSADLTFTIDNNNIQQAFDEAINLNLGTASTAASSMIGTISNNIIGTAGDPDSGSESGTGISVISNGAGLTTVAITGNQVRQYANPYGILVNIKEGSSSMNATVTGNTVKNPGSFAINGIRVDAGATAGDSGTLCAVVTGNSVAGSGPGADTDIRLRQRFNTTIKLPGYGGSNSDTTAVNSFVAGNNAGSDVSSAHNVGGGGGGFIGGAACPTP